MEFICAEKRIQSIPSISETLPPTCVHLTEEYIWISMDRELPSVQLSFLWCTVLWIGTTENSVCHKWMHYTLSLMSTRCFHRVLWELAKWWWFLKVWASLALFDGIIKTISMAFSRNIFQAYIDMFVFENNVFTFWQTAKSTKCTCSSCPLVAGLGKWFYCSRHVYIWLETRNVKYLSRFLL